MSKYHLIFAHRLFTLYRRKINMTKLLSMMLATSTLLFAASSYAEPMTSLRICADPGNMPYSNTQGEGFSNKIAEVLAEALDTQVSYFYRPYLERGLTRQTFKNDVCDVLMDMSPDNERMITTTPIYRSTFVLVSRKDRNYKIKNLDDPRLKELTVGVFQHSAIRTELMEHGVNGTNMRLHIISHDADLNPEDQPTQQIKAVVDGKLDVAGAWGPLAGWYNTDKVPGGETKPLDILYLNQTDTVLPMEFEMTLGLKTRDVALRDKLNNALVQQRDKIKQVLSDYGVPLVACDTCIVSGDIPSHGPYKHAEPVIAKFQPTPQSDLAKLPAQVDAALAGGSTLDDELFNAVLAKDFTRIDYLLERGANIDAHDAVGLTPLMNAVKGGHYPLVRKLLKKGANVDVVDIDGWSASMHAAWQNEPKMIRTMGAGYGANLDLKDKLTDSTALALATQKGKAVAVVALLDSGAKPDITMGDARYTALMVAAQVGMLPAAQALLQYEANVNAKNAGGVTPLMIATANNKPKLVALLIKSGADKTIKDDEGLTALDLAKARDLEDIISYLTDLK